MAEIFESPISQKEGGILTRLWRSIVNEGNYRRSLLTLVNEYTQKHIQLKGSVANVKRKTRSSLLADINAREMTFKVILHLVFKLLRAKSVKITFEVTHFHGKVSEHSVVINSDNFTEEEDG